jgi:uncharacterized protein
MNAHAYRNRVERKRLKLERKYIALLEKVFNKQLNDFTKAIEDNLYGAVYSIDIYFNDVLLERALTRLWQETGEEFRIDNVEAILIKSINPSTWSSLLGQWIATTGAEKIKTINGFTREFVLRKLRPVLNQGVQEGLGIPEIARNIIAGVKEYQGSFAKYRATRIARTEIVGMSNRASLMSAESAGLKNQIQKFWIPFIINIIKDINIEKREVVFAFSKFNDYDSDDDITMNGAFSKTIRESGPDGSDRIRHVWNHSKSNPPIGRLLKMWEDSEFAYAHSKMVNNQTANDVWDAYKEGALNEHSYFGKSYNPERNEKGGILIKEVKLFEVSSVLWGAQESAKLKQLIKGDIMGMDAIKELKEHLLSMDKFVKKSNGSDDFLYQLESEIQKAMDIILPISLEQEQAVIKTPDPIEPKHEFSLAELYKLKTFN